ncbi:hypothetical protein COY07_04475 [Candidatus Peregrinibacteria bacterium CG_4_10_14_0_2_um_filter_43_11]|nr:MAG: hypothetical protein COY07_04475 [Candidatus Peregrinibacteria bacterium CG_4_10_14_0_2_um_filter_43_11]
MSKKVKSLAKHLGLTGLFCCGLFMVLTVNAYAQGALGNNWSQFLGGLPNFPGAEGIAGEDLAINFIRNGIRILEYVIGGIAAIFGIIAGMQFIFSGGKEESITKQKKVFVSMFIAFVLLMVAEQIANIFNPETSTAKALIDFSAANDQLRDIANYIKWLFGSAIVLIMVITGIQLIVSDAQEETLTKAKKHLLWSGIGMLVMLLADNIINAIYVINETTQEIVPGDVKTITEEVVGIIRLILVFLGPITVLFTLYAGFLLSISMDAEEKSAKAKKMITAGIVGIVVVYSAYAIVNTIISAPELTL